MSACSRPLCDSDLPATYGFFMDSFDGEPQTYVRYCSRCVMLCIQQDYFSDYEVDTLHKLSRRQMAEDEARLCDYCLLAAEALARSGRPLSLYGYAYPKRFSNPE